MFTSSFTHQSFYPSIHPSFLHHRLFILSSFILSPTHPSSSSFNYILAWVPHFVRKYSTASPPPPFQLSLLSFLPIFTHLSSNPFVSSSLILPKPKFPLPSFPRFYPLPSNFLNSIIPRSFLYFSSLHYPF